MLGTLVLGLLWVGWHLPLFFYPGWTSASLWVYTLLLLSLSYLLTFVANLAGGALAAIVSHAAFNTVSTWLNGFLAPTDVDIDVPVELVMALSAFAIVGILAVATRGRLAYRGNGTPGELPPLP